MGRGNKATAVLVLIACLCVVAPAAPRSDLRQGILDRAEVLASATHVTHAAYPNADLVQIDEYTLCEYQPDGTGVTWSDNYTKVLTEKGRRQEQAVSYRFLLPYDKVAVTVLEVIKPDGTVVPVDIETQGKVMIDREQMYVNIYNPDMKVLQIGVPDVQIGDVLHVVTQRETMKRYMPDTWDDYQVFESMSPIKHAVYEVRAPRERPLSRLALRDPVEDTVTYEKHERDGQMIYRWVVSDVPRIYQEPSMPPYHTVVQRLLVSTLPDWEAISRWYWQLCTPHLEATTPAMQEIVAKLTAGLTGRQQKIEAIFYWVSQQVRYMGITTETDSPGWEPHDVHVTFENRHGVCRDKAALLAAMLRLAGFEAYPVLIDAGPKKDAEVPIVQFNHAIVGVRDEDGSYQLMDCTDESTKDLLPTYLCDRSYLVAHPQGETLQTSPIVPAEENLVLVETTGRIDARGNLTAEAELQFAGINDNAYRTYFARIRPEERRRYFEGVLKASIATAALTAFEVRPADIQDTSQSLSIHLGFTAEDILVGNGETVMMPVPHVGTKVGLVNFIIRQTGLKERRFPLETQFACGVRENLHLQIDPAVGAFVSVPQFTPIEDQTISWKRQIEQGTNAITGHAEFLIKTVELDPQQYVQLKESLKQIEYNERKMSILARQTDANAPRGDVVMLEHRVDYTLDDARNWTERHSVKKEIRTYKGKKDNAELKLDYNPVWEELSLIRATVTNGGQVKQISGDEINLMDAAWVAAAPRYPAAKTLVASLPAVEVGSIIEYEYERRRKNHPFFEATHIFRSFDPLAHKTIRLTAPASLTALRFITDDNGIAIADEEPSGQRQPVIVESSERTGETVTRQWTVQGQAPIKPEDALPPPHSFNPILRITTGNWQAYAEEVLAALQEATRGQAAAEQRARAITAQVSSPAEKIVAIRDFVVRNIRAAGPDCDELPLEAVTRADQTLADGYGNTTDRAVLLYAMLKAAGLSPEFVLVNYGSQVELLKRFDVRYPTAQTFGTVLVRVRSDGDEVYLNDTNQYAVLGTTPADGRLALPLREAKTETISVAQDKKDLRVYEYRLRLTEQGDARIAVTQRNYGTAFAARHKMFAEMPPEERNRYYQELVANIAQAAVADSTLATDFESYPGVESFSVHIKQYAVRDGDFLYFELPRSLSHLFSLRSDTHENPFYQSADYRFRVSTTVELPEGFADVVLAPEQNQWLLPADGGTVQVQVSRQRRDDGITALVITHEVELNPFILDAGRYADLLAVERQLTHAEARTVLVARRQ